MRLLAPVIWERRFQQAAGAVRIRRTAPRVSRDNYRAYGRVAAILMLPCQIHVYGLRGDVVAYGIMHFFPGGTREQYDASMAAVHPGGGQLPHGQLFHAGGATPGGWMIIAIHDSQESWERFRDGIARPRSRQGIEGGLPVPPQETTFEVHTLVSQPQQ